MALMGAPHGFNRMALIRSFAVERDGRLYRIEVRRCAATGTCIKATIPVASTPTNTERTRHHGPSNR